MSDNIIDVETKRLLLRPYRTEDVDDAYKYLGDMEVMRYLAMPRDYFSVIEYVNQNMNDPQSLNYVIEDKETGKAIGEVQFELTEQRGVFGLEVLLAREYQGKGYATEIGKGILEFFFGTLKAHKIYGITLEESGPSHAMLKSWGMEMEGILKKQRFHYAKWLDEYHYAILREEWEDQE